MGRELAVGSTYRGGTEASKSKEWKVERGKMEGGKVAKLPREDECFRVYSYSRLLVTAIITVPNKNTVSRTIPSSDGVD